MKRKTGFTTSILHADRESVIEHGSLHKPLHTSVAYGYRDARELEVKGWAGDTRWPVKPRSRTEH